MLNTFLIIGRPGSGKSVQAKMLANLMEYKRFSPGEKFREIATHDTALGNKIKGIMDSGLLGPSWLSIYLFQNVILNIEDSEGIVFEGVGRKEEEAKKFDETAKWLDRDYKVIDVVVSEEEITKRLALRKNKESREDDDPEDVIVRIKEYDTHTLPAIDFFKSIGKYIEINGEQTVEVVHKELIKKINK